MTTNEKNFLSNDACLLQKALLLLNQANTNKDKNVLVNLHLDVSRAYYNMLNIPESWVALNNAQKVVDFAESIRPEIKKAIEIQTGILHAANEREFKTMFLYSKRSDKEALTRLSERPNFYTDVYFMIKPKICYAKYARKFFDLVDIILSSSHVPIYIVAAFVKRLSRVLLNAPLYCQSPIISIIKNIMQRNKFVHDILVNRKEPGSVENDPYDENERDLKKCRATDSSLWELRAIQHHWHYKIAEKANFIDRHVQTDETHVEWKTNNKIFQTTLNHSLAKLKRRMEIKSKNKKKDKMPEDEVEDEEKDSEENDYSTENEEEQNSTDKRLQFVKNSNKIKEVLTERPLVKESFDLNENAPDDVQKNFFFGISADDNVWEI